MSTKRVYRRAMLADKEGVLDIARDIYDGTDYLPSMYERFMQEDHRGYVCEEDGKILAFGLISFVDGGETVVMRSGRIRKEYQGQRVYRPLADMMIAYYTSIPSVQYTAWSSPVDMTTTLSKVTYKITIYKCHVFLCSISQIPISKPDTDAIIVQEVNALLMTAICNSQKSRERLFPDGIMLVHHIPFRPAVVNMKYFINNMTYIVGSFDSNPEMTEIQDLDKQEIRLMTIATFFPSPNGLVYLIDVCGRDIQDFRAHMRLHVDNIRNLTSKKLTMIIMMSDSNDMKQIDIQLNMKFNEENLQNIYYFHDDLSKL